MSKRNRVDAVTWEEPPPRPPQYDWSRISAELRQHPMRWAKIFEKDRRSVAVAILQGSIKVVHPGMGFEVRTSNNVYGTPRTCTLHMRFNPDKVDPLRAAVTREGNN